MRWCKCVDVCGASLAPPPTGELRLKLLSVSKIDAQFRATLCLSVFRFVVIILCVRADSRKADWLPYYKEAQSLEKANRIGEAEQQYQVVLDLCCDSAEGKETVAVATARRDLGRVLALQRKFDRAEEQYKVCAVVL